MRQSLEASLEASTIALNRVTDALTSNVIRLIIGDSREMLCSLPDESVHCVVTSPPYYGLRDYGTAQWEGGEATCDHKQGRPGSGRADGVVDERSQRNRDGVGSIGGDCRQCGARRIDRQLGLEATPDAYIAEMVAVFREVRRVLRSDGTLWLNIGDSYAAAGGSGAGGNAARMGRTYQQRNVRPNRHYEGIKPKDLIGIPWMLAFALRADGWWLRQDIIWSKPNPMPESVTDRCTKAHEYLFLLTKSQRYWFDTATIKEPAQDWSKGGPGVGILPTTHYSPINGGNRGLSTLAEKYKRNEQSNTRNKRSVWSIATSPFSGTHYATFPPKLIKPCILAGCPEGGTVLDPFGGSGTVGWVCEQTNRNAILIDLDPKMETYLDMRRAKV